MDVFWRLVPTLCLIVALHTSVLGATSSHCRRAESASFVVVSDSSLHDAQQTAELCEAWRARLQDQWCQKRDAAWTPKCEVVIHASRGGYVGAVGYGSAQTYASSLINRERGSHMTVRRIDICGDGQLGIAALPHELTHLVLADLFGGRQAPRWADEGLAVLADPRDKQVLHQRDLASCLARGTEFRLGELLLIESYPHPSRVPAFYGQSDSLAAFLIGRDEPTKFIEFLRRAMEQGYDRALKETYSIENVTQLERQWRAWCVASMHGKSGG